jgi:hypothetical protein
MFYARRTHGVGRTVRPHLSASVRSRATVGPVGTRAPHYRSLRGRAIIPRGAERAGQIVDCPAPPRHSGQPRKHRAESDAASGQVCPTGQESFCQASCRRALGYAPERRRLTDREPCWCIGREPRRTVVEQAIRLAFAELAPARQAAGRRRLETELATVRQRGVLFI